MTVPTNSPFSNPPGLQPSIQRIRQSRAPTSNDIKNVVVGDEWLDTSSEDWYKLASLAGNVANWVRLGGTGGPVESFIVSSGTSPVVPNANNEITLIDGNGIAWTGGINSLTCDMSSPFTGDFAFDGIVTVNQLTVDNLQLNGNTLSSTNTNGDINLSPNGTGSVGVATQLRVGDNPPTTTSIQSTVQFSNSGASVGHEVRNTSNTADSDAFSSLVVAGASAADPYLTWSVSGSTTYSMGIRNSDSDALYLTGGAGESPGLAATLLMKVTDAGEFTYPLQPSFLADKTSSQFNVTGNGTIATVSYDTEIFDQGGDYDGTTTFTAPVTGRYAASGSSFVVFLGAATEVRSYIVTSNRTYNGPFETIVSAQAITLLTIAESDMDAADTMFVQSQATGTGADTAAFATDIGKFSAALIC